jgi:hypothetical protein
MEAATPCDGRCLVATSWGQSSTGTRPPGWSRPDPDHSSAGPVIAVENLWVPCAKKVQICVLLGEKEWIMRSAVRGPMAVYLGKQDP